MEGAAEISCKDRSKFEEMVLGTVIRVLREVFGEAGASFIHSYLKRRVGLEKEMIPRKFDKFRSEMTEMLGSGGVAVLNKIVEELAIEVGVEAPRDAELSFEDKLSVLSESYLSVVSGSHSQRALSL